MSTDREGGRPRPPDAFFPGVPRIRVVLLGVAMIVGGVAIAIVVPFLTVIPGSSSQRISVFFFFLGSAIAVLGVVFLFKKPTRGSTPGSAAYDRLVAEQRAEVYRTFVMRVWSGLVVSFLLAVALLPVGLVGLSEGSEAGPVYLALGIIEALGVPAFGLAIWAARTGRLKNVQRPHTPGR